MGKFLDETGLSTLVTNIKTALGKKQDKLTSGTNIKTVNRHSLLGSGDVTVGDVTQEGNNSFSGTNKFYGSLGIGTPLVFVNGEAPILTINGQGGGTLELVDNVNADPVTIKNVESPVQGTDAANKSYVDTQISKKQDKLTSGTNIKTVNRHSLLGSGDVTVGDVTKADVAATLQAVQIYQGNTTADKKANVDNIKAYENNLKAFGVDVGKGYNIPVASVDYNMCGCMWLGKNNNSVYIGILAVPQNLVTGTSNPGVRIFSINKSSGQFNVVYIPTDNVATTSKNGLMSAKDKSKLDGIDTTLPVILDFTGLTTFNSDSANYITITKSIYDRIINNYPRVIVKVPSSDAAAGTYKYSTSIGSAFEVSLRDATTGTNLVAMNMVSYPNAGYVLHKASVIITNTGTEYRATLSALESAPITDASAVAAQLATI